MENTTESLISDRLDLAQTYLADIVAKSRYLSEYLDRNLLGGYPPPVAPNNESSDRFKRWCQTVAQGNWKKFHQRLQWDDLDLKTIDNNLRGQPHITHQSLPRFAYTLEKIIEASSQYSRGSFNWETEREDSQLLIPRDPDRALPFEDLLLPGVYVARQKLFHDLGCQQINATNFILDRLQPKAYFQLEHNLLSVLVSLCEKTLDFEFSQFRPQEYRLLNFLVTNSQLNPPTKYYQAFVQLVLQDGMLKFFQDYPVLARLIATKIDFWVEATADFLLRLKSDSLEIQELFQENVAFTEWESKDNNCLAQNSLGKITHIKPNLSDSHNQGRSALSLTFESGLKLVYKPKDLGLELAYNQILGWCNQQFSSPPEKQRFLDVSLSPKFAKFPHSASYLPFKTVKVLNHQTYGWVEYIEQLPVEDETAAQRFYQRTGMLLCLLYVLGATDCHYENVIASGEHLVLVDLETLMHHEARLEEFPEQWHQVAVNRSQLHQQFSDLVLRTGLLPRWDFNKDRSIAYDLSGLSSIDSQPSVGSVLQWKFVNTDNMHRSFQTVAIPVAKNVPILRGIPLLPTDYVDDLVAGFEQMYAFFLFHRHQLLAGNMNSKENLAQSSPLEKLRYQQVRFVFRSTKVYGVILQNTLAPEFLRNGIDRSIELDILARAFLGTDSKPKAWSILHAELRAMEQLDIPYFGANSDSNHLTIGVEKAINNFFELASYQQVMTRLQKLGEADRSLQVSTIRGAFYAKVARLYSAATVVENLPPTINENSEKNPITRKQLIASAAILAEDIQSKAMRDADRNLSWIALISIPNTDRFQLQSLNESFYEGHCGIALFFAALNRITGNRQYRNLALEVLQAFRRFLQTSDTPITHKFANKMGIGGLTGLGSSVYCLVKISQLLEETALLEDAKAVASLITPESIAADQTLDVMTGTAGTLLGLLALYHSTGERAILEKAIACGQHLLKHHFNLDTFREGKNSFGQKLFIGFARGITGMIYALVQLYRVTNDRHYLTASLEGMTYERRVFLNSIINRSDDRVSSEQNSQSRVSVNRCHGAAGIALSRLGALSILPTAEIEQDLKVSLQMIQESGLQVVDNLYCGNFGLIEVLLLASEKGFYPNLQEIALQRAAFLMAKSAQTGGYQLFPNLPSHVFNPSFFLGVAGIGYELLRLAYPERLPSVLLLE